MPIEQLSLGRANRHEIRRFLRETVKLVQDMGLHRAVHRVASTAPGLQSQVLVNAALSALKVAVGASSGESLQTFENRHRLSAQDRLKAVENAIALI